MSDRSKANRRWLVKQYSINPRCCICGKVTLFDEELSRLMHRYNLPLPNHYATIEHIYPKSDIRRLLRPHDIDLACYKCNQDKGIADSLVFTNPNVEVNIIHMWLTGQVEVVEL